MWDPFRMAPAESHRRALLISATVAAGVGVLVAGIGLFAPMWDSASVTAFRIEGNSVLQSGRALFPAIGMLAVAVGLVLWWTGRRGGWLVLGGGVILIGYALITRGREDLMTLCPSTAFTRSDCQSANAGLGLYAVAIGGGLATLAGALLVIAEPSPVSARAGSSRVALIVPLTLVGVAVLLLGVAVYDKHSLLPAYVAPAMGGTAIDTSVSRKAGADVTCEPLGKETPDGGAYHCAGSGESECWILTNPANISGSGIRRAEPSEVRSLGRPCVS